MSHSTPALTERDKNFQKYFTALAPSYASLTGNTTKLVASAALDLVELPSGKDVRVHDNACGIGTVALVVIDKCKGSGALAPEIIATDYTPAMIEALQKAIEADSGRYNGIQAKVGDSQALEFPDDHFEFSICNISIENFNDAHLALKEIHRTLKPGNTAIVTNWKVFGFASVLADARSIYTGAPAPPPPYCDDFTIEGRIAEAMAKAGFDAAKVQTHAVKVVASEEKDLQGTIRFMTGTFVPLVSTLEESERPKWKESVGKAISERKSRDGGIVCEAWVVIATK